MQKYLSTKEVASILGISDRMVRAYIGDKFLPAIRLQKLLKVGEDDLKNWLEERKTGRQGER